jgi:two-component system, OmpR family, response regulator PhoP
MASPHLHLSWVKEGQPNEHCMLMRDHPPLFPYAPPHTIRIAVLEGDEVFRRDHLLPSLHGQGFHAQDMRSATELYRCMLAQSFDIVLLDIELPGENGLMMTQHLRAASDVGIVIFTRQVYCGRHVEALQRGADFYFAKPVDLDALSAMLHSLARRLPLSKSSAMREPTGPRRWRLEAGGWRLLSPWNNAVALTSSERCVLMALTAVCDQPVARETLVEALSQNAYDTDLHRMEMIIYRLRKKVQTQTGCELPLITVRGKGYVLLSEA